ncbi:uncharacterized protein ASPGLDRAFT_35661 [Aspergillus glaucus CBS 516.65]|uniref:Uncharacterized protein n=1 Tax=Aspergillus glaucus CBS 516.65 TaxID=1160497 RepID=A0A1L9VKF2_ASPGL|nr:hypothetical protein ASPGLDRAFT_35661 [Aspergillus glaucus CBS 516.65]OJJ84397.1 hypothetical protein ASPGLDRAFT_35661 [Aspergillus glaucus CBS 516.65]
MGIEADHISICKFASITALGFEVIAEALHRYAHDAPKVIEQRWREEELTRQLKKARKLNTLLIKERTLARAIWWGVLCEVTPPETKVITMLMKLRNSRNISLPTAKLVLPSGETYH